ncbi:MAG: hypothetical protein PF904_10910 [Kiritimatiellae bacterium]|jgi:hypothetical protein|nr:hypothetical protein [Kiritimatiellia bacterium]
MTITLQSTSPKVICDGLAYRTTVDKYYGPLGEGHSEAAWAVPYSRPIRNTSAIPIDRGQGEYKFDLKVRRLFASESAAVYFRLTYPGLFPRGENNLLVQETGQSNVTYPGAVLESIQIDQLGCSCEITYTFKTQEPTT